MQFTYRSTALIASFAIFLAITVGACGLIADKDQIVVGMLDGKPIHRKDLKDALRAMKDEERPIIGNRGDVERYLREYVDRRIREGLALDLSAESKIEVPREQAEAMYFAAHPDEAAIQTMTDPTPLGITARELEGMKSELEYEIDLVHDALLRERAVQYTAQQWMEEGLITISDEEYQREYEIQKSNLKSLEYIDFIALMFPKEMPDAVTIASDVRRRIDAGESFDSVLQEFLQRDKRFVLASRFENNPNSQNFRSFWMSAAGVEKGQIIGPVFIPAYSLLDSKGEAVQMPDAYLVLFVEDHQPPTSLTLEAAKPFLMQSIAIRKAVELLRDEHGAEFYDDKLWDPGRVGEQDFQA